MHSKKYCEENKTVMSHKLLGGQLAIAVEVKESFSDEVTVETQVCGNQPGIGMEETLQESSKHREFGSFEVQRGGRFGWSDLTEWENGTRKVECRQESDERGPVGRSMECGF